MKIAKISERNTLHRKVALLRIEIGTRAQFLQSLRLHQIVVPHLAFYPKKREKQVVIIIFFFNSKKKNPTKRCVFMIRFSKWTICCLNLVLSLNDLFQIMSCACAEIKLEENVLKQRWVCKPGICPRRLMSLWKVSCSVLANALPSKCISINFWVNKISECRGAWIVFLSLYKLWYIDGVYVCKYVQCIIKS